MLSKILRAIDEIFPPQIAYAHCDVPCGIYETDTITHAANTCAKMVEKLLALQKPADSADLQTKLNFKNTVIRMVETKEKFAHKCKEELLILWTDYFKDEHLKMFPDLHTKFWKATKLCSTVKRNVDAKACADLQNVVKEIAEIFKKAKEAEAAKK